MVEELKNVRLATEVHYLFKDEKICSDVQKSLVQPEPKLTGNMLPIAPTVE